MSAGSTGKSAGPGNDQVQLANTPTQDQTNQFSQGITPNTASGGQPNPLAQFAPGAGASATDLTAQNFNQGGALTSSNTVPQPTPQPAPPSMDAAGPQGPGMDPQSLMNKYSQAVFGTPQASYTIGGAQQTNAPESTGQSALQTGINGLGQSQQLFNQYSNTLFGTPQASYSLNPAVNGAKDMYNTVAQPTAMPPQAPVGTPKPSLPAFAQPAVTGGQSQAPYVTARPNLPQFAQPMRPNQLPKLPATLPAVKPGYTGGGINTGPQATGLGSINTAQRPGMVMNNNTVGTSKISKPTMYQAGQSNKKFIPQATGLAKPVPGKVNVAPMRR